MAEFLAMGGYGAYVWSAYAATAAVLAGNAAAAWLRLRRLRARLRRGDA